MGVTMMLSSGYLSESPMSMMKKFFIIPMLGSVLRITAGLLLAVCIQTINLTILICTLHRIHPKLRQNVISGLGLVTRLSSWGCKGSLRLLRNQTKVRGLL